MEESNVLEVTITHNIGNDKDVADLLSRRWIAVDWGRKGPDPDLYTGRGRTDVKLFHRMREEGAAVIAAYKGATDNRSDRLIGWIKPGSPWKRLNKLLCLQLSKAKMIDSSSSSLGNLSPRSCTVQTCHNRSRGRLARIVLDKRPVRSVDELHHLDVEWLVTNYLVSQKLCASVWSGSRSYEDIDHAGYSRTGREVFAQTTVSAHVVGTKAERLIGYGSSKRDLLLFGPEAGRPYCPKGIRYYSIEEVFSALDRTVSGRKLIDRMLAVSAS